MESRCVSSVSLITSRTDRRGHEGIVCMESVWLLWFEQQREVGQDTELLIGVYRTEDSAKAAIDRVKDQPGFRDYPQGFAVYEHFLDKDSWTSGFARV